MRVWLFVAVAAHGRTAKDHDQIHKSDVLVDSGSQPCDPASACEQHRGVGMKEEYVELEQREENHAALAEGVAAAGKDVASDVAAAVKVVSNASTAWLANVQRVEAGDPEGSLRVRKGTGREASVQLPFGRVVGRQLETTDEYLGVPYAAKPVRFEEPEAWIADFPGGGWSAKKPTRCPQAPYSEEDQSEDCLHLNVYAPRAEGDPRPVMLWFHGGSFKTGSASEVNGTRLAGAEDVVVVSANYRLGVLGFAPTNKDGKHNAPALANNGFKDQRQAMRWVREHISAFGGDPQRITIFGQGSGGTSVHVHMVSPGSKDLFARALSQSSDVESYLTLDEALGSTQEVADAVGCSDPADLTCLRAADVEALVAAYNQLEGLVVGDEFLPQSPMELAAKWVADVPLLVSSTADEGNAFAYLGADWLGEMTRAQAQGVFEGVSPSHSRELMDMYGRDSSGAYHTGDFRPALGEMIGDCRFLCSDKRFLAALHKRGHTKTWRSSFRRGNPCKLEDDIRGAFHGVELPFVFNNIEDSCMPRQKDVALAAAVSGLWAAFAREGAPPAAMKWAPGGDTVALLGAGLSLDGPVDTQAGLRSTQCAFLDQALPNGNVLEDFVTGILVTSSLHQRLHHFLKEKVINFIIQSVDLITSFAANSTHMTIHRNRVHTVVYLILLGLAAVAVNGYLRRPAAAKEKLQHVQQRALFRRELTGTKRAAPTKLGGVDPTQKGIAARIAAAARGLDPPNDSGC